MPLTPESAKSVDKWNARKNMQLGVVRATMPEVNLISWGPKQTIHTIQINEDGFLENVIIGQLPSMEYEPSGHGRNFRVVPEIRRRAENKTIDLDDQQIELVLECWKRRTTAKNLEFVKDQPTWNRDDEG